VQRVPQKRDCEPCLPRCLAQHKVKAVHSSFIASGAQVPFLVRIEYEISNSAIARNQHGNLLRGLIVLGVLQVIQTNTFGANHFSLGRFGIVNTAEVEQACASGLVLLPVLRLGVVHPPAD